MDDTSTSIVHVSSTEPAETNANVYYLNTDIIDIDLLYLKAGLVHRNYVASTLALIPVPTIPVPTTCILNPSKPQRALLGFFTQISTYKTLYT